MNKQHVVDCEKLTVKINDSLQVVNAHKLSYRALTTTGMWLLVAFSVLLLGLSSAANATAPTVTTGAATGVTSSTATLNGTVNANNHNISKDGFNYGLTTGYGSSVNGAPYTVTTGAGTTNVSATVTGLTCNTTYHYRIWATNSNGTTNGSDATLTTSACPLTIVSINLAGASPTNAASVSWTVTFSQNVTGVSASDFTLVNSGLGGAPAITSVTGSGSTWTVTASTGTGSGTLGLNATSTTGTSPAVTGLPFTGQVYSINHIPPTVSSINLANTNPAYGVASVSWTVTFSESVTGVSASDFSLAITGLGGPPAITSVTGSGSTWTVTASTGTGSGSLGLNQTSSTGVTDAAGNTLTGTFTGQVYTVQAFCSPPSNIPAGVTVSCQCDTFGRASLNPSTIFGGNWNVSTGSTDTTGIVPYINSTTGLLRLTENTSNNAKAATVPGIFPAAGNYISVEFQEYAYDSTAPGNIGNCASNTGADGIAVTLSDYSVPPVPGGFGGSLGYAQRTDSTPNPPGFAGGWVGIALDDWGNYQNPTEGRILGPGPTCESVGARGPGTGVNGYRWMAGTGSNPGGLKIDNYTSTTPAPGYMYQVIVDATNSATGTINISVNRDSTTMNGANYTSLFGPFNAYTEANYALSQGWISQIVPNYWTISFTGSTGGSNNIHEIGSLRVCAQTIIPPTGGTASGFSAIDSAYPAASGSTVPAYPNFQTGHIYMKLMGTPFNLWVAALTSTGISTGYSSTSAKYVQVKLVDNSGSICGPDSARTCNSTCAALPAAETGTGATQIATFTKGGTTGVASPSPAFTLNSAWKDLIAVMQECTTSACTAFTATAPACSADSFSVRPTSITSVTSPDTNAGTGGTPTIIAGTGNFSLTANIAGVGTNPDGYTGVPQINSASVQAIIPPATVTGTLAGTFAAATSGSGSSTATGTTFTYSEVGAFQLLASDFTVPRIPGVYDTTWTAIDSDPTKNDCNTGTSAAAYSNTLDANGKYGCYFGITATAPSPAGGFGRFIPAYFNVTPTVQGCATFTYSGQPFAVTVTPFNGLAANTKNYVGALAKQVTISAPSGTANFTNNGILATGFALNSITNLVSGSTNLITNPLSGANPPMYYTFPGPGKETQPLTLTLRASDLDGVSSLGHTEGSTTIDSGRLHLLNAYGSELADLLMPMQVEYYSGTANGWIVNGSDTCSTVGLKALSYQTLPVGTTCVQDTGNPGFSGQGCATAGPVSEGYLQYPNLTNPNPITNTTIPIGSYDLYLKAPGAGNYGSVNVTASLASTMPWLEYDWKGTGTAIEPTGQAIFGQYRGSPRNIYLRELY
ncbi:MAG: DUF6701 domain-containing protein [Sulfuricaulis sp.]